MTLDEQFLTMIAMAGGGAGMGAVTDTWRMWRTRSCYLLALLTGILQGALLFWLLYQVNGGIVRSYVFLALGCGFAFYQALLRSYYLRILHVFTTIIKGVGKGIGVLFRPFLRFGRFVYKCLKKGMTYVVWSPFRRAWQAGKTYVRKILRK